MTPLDVFIVLGIVVVWLASSVIKMAKHGDRLASRVDDLEAWVLPQKKREQEQRELERLRAAIEKGFEDGIMVPPEVLRQAYPDRYPPDEKSKPPGDSSV
jgi:hypothetical protein